MKKNEFARTRGIDESMTWICDYCETENLNDIKVCPKCKTWLCDNCNAQNFPRYRYCVECGVNRKRKAEK